MTTKAVYPKTSCVVPGCRRTSRRFPDEWVCGEHWRLVDTTLKRYRTRALHARRKLPRRRWRRLEALIWRRMKRQAIERAAGL